MPPRTQQPTTRRRPARSHPNGYAPEETRQALVDSALALFGARGYAAASVQEITENAGVTKGAFYHHFASKEDVLRLIHDEFVDFQLAAVKRAIAEGDDPADQLAGLLREFLLSVERYQANVAIFYQERRYLTGQRFKAVKHKRDEFDRLFLEIVERGVKEGVFRSDFDPHVIAFGILGMVGWTHQWYRPDGARSAEEIATMFARMTLDGIRTG